MNDLEKYFRNNQANLITKWAHYFKVYDRYLSRYRNSDVHILEIGVCHGGSLQMWKEYFGPQARIFGVDMGPESKKFEESQVEIFIGDQEDKSFLEHLKRQIPRIDVLLDDGGHTMAQQLATFDVLFPYIADDGIYICEDTHTSYWSGFGGGFRRPGTFIEFAKGLVDDIHGYHRRGKDSKLELTEFTRSIGGLHFYDSMVVIEKERRCPPEQVYSGEPRLTNR